MFTTNISPRTWFQGYMEFKLQLNFRGNLSHRAWDRRILSLLLYNAKFLAKIAKNGHCALIGAR